MNMVRHDYKCIQFHKWIMFWNFCPKINGGFSDNGCPSLQYPQNIIPVFWYKSLQNKIRLNHNRIPVIWQMGFCIYFEIFPSF